MIPYKPKVLAPTPEHVAKTEKILQNYALNSVCEAAYCPNRSECYAKNRTTFMILGDTCTRNCHFCAVTFGKPKAPDPDEAYRLAQAVKAMNLHYVVLTSVDRDDLSDYGSAHFKACVEAIQKENPDIKIELLTPDFRADPKALRTITELNVEKLAHNQESTERISKRLRPQSSYKRSLETLYFYAKSGHTVKSSLMLGLGEHYNELIQTLQDLLNVGVTELTLGQYLQASPKHYKVVHYYEPDFFQKLKVKALHMGFRAVASGILVRSSYFADTY